MSSSMDVAQQDSGNTNPLYYSLSAGVRQRVDSLLIAESSRRNSISQQHHQQHELRPPPPLSTATPSTTTPSPEPWPPSCYPNNAAESNLSPPSDKRRRHTTFVDAPHESSCGDGEFEVSTLRRHHHPLHPLHVVPGVFHRVGWGGIPSGLLVSGGGSVSGGASQIHRRVSRDGAVDHTTSSTHHHSSSTEELKLRIHQLEYKVRLGLEREQQWMSENQLLRDELRKKENNAGDGYDENDDMRSNDSQSTIAATTTVRRPRENDDNDGCDEAAASSAPPVNPKLALLHMQADEAAYRSRIEVESMARLWGEFGVGGGVSSSSFPSPPSSIWTTFLVESHRASLHTHRSSAQRLESLDAQLRIATESNVLKTKENCILLDQLKQMQQYHERERKVFRDKLLDVVQSITGTISATSSPPPE